MAIAVAAGAYKGEVLFDLLARSAAVEPHAQVAPAPYAWALPDTPFVTAGAMADGGWSPLRMLEAWKAVGVTPDEAATVLMFLHEHALPTVLGRGQEAAVIAREAGMVSADMALAKGLPLAHAKLKAIGPSTPIEGFDWENAGSASMAPWLELVGEMGMLAPSMTDLPIDASAGLVAAREALGNAASEAGVRELRVPLVVWGDALRLVDMAEGLRHANTDLQLITGWKGGVLGLDGRLVLTMGVVDHAMVDGHLPDGSMLAMEADWGELAHEWMHALDFVMARQVLHHPRIGTLTSHRKGWLQRWGAPPAAHAWWNAVDQIETAGAPWVARRQAELGKNALARRGFDPHYWTDPSELLAYAWEARLKRAEHLTVLGQWVPGEDEADARGVVLPRAAELSAMESAWEPMLEEARRALAFERAAPFTRLAGLQSPPPPPPPSELLEELSLDDEL